MPCVGVVKEGLARLLELVVSLDIMMPGERTDHRSQDYIEIDVIW